MYSIYVTYKITQTHRLFYMQHGSRPVKGWLVHDENPDVKCLALSVKIILLLTSVE
jgi:hypothetical protein